MTQKHHDTLAPKAYLKLHHIGRKYMLVETQDGCTHLTNVYSMNETAAWLWQRVCTYPGHTPEELAAAMCLKYRVEYERALHDVQHQLEEWKQMGLL